MSNREDFQYGSTANYPLLIEQRFRNLRLASAEVCAGAGHGWVLRWRLARVCDGAVG